MFLNITMVTVARPPNLRYVFLHLAMFKLARPAKVCFFIDFANVIQCSYLAKNA